MKTKILLLALSLSVTANSYGQFSLTGEIRPRTEYRHGYKTLMDSAQQAGIFTSQRTRLNFGFSNEKIKTGISLQDVRTWGNQPQLNVFEDSTYSLHNAWAEILFNKKFSLRAGRQELAYDDERILGAVGWIQQGRSHDAFLLKYADSTFTAHLGSAYNQSAETNVATAYSVSPGYKELYFLWLNKKINNLSISFLQLNNGNQSPVNVNTSRFSYTTGIHAEYNKSPLLAGLRYYNQAGNDVSGKKVEGYFAGAHFQYTFNKKITLGIGTEILSGQNQTDTAKTYKEVVHQFTPFYGTGHKFNGYMDYFFAGSPHGNVGLNDIYLSTKYKSEKWWMGIDVHSFSANGEVLDNKIFASNKEYKAMSSDLGTEIDLTYSYNLGSGITIQLGYSQMLATETLSALKGGKKNLTQNWGYLMLSFNPVFIKN